MFIFCDCLFVLFVILLIEDVQNEGFVLLFDHI